MNGRRTQSVPWSNFVLWLEMMSNASAQQNYRYMTPLLRRDEKSIYFQLSEFISSRSEMKARKGKPCDLTHPPAVTWGIVAKNSTKRHLRPMLTKRTTFTSTSFWKDPLMFWTKPWSMAHLLSWLHWLTHSSPSAQGLTLKKVQPVNLWFREAVFVSSEGLLTTTVTTFTTYIFVVPLKNATYRNCCLDWNAWFRPPTWLSISKNTV